MGLSLAAKKHWEKIVLVTLCIQIEWVFCNVRSVWNCPAVCIDRRLNSLMFYFLNSSWRSLLPEAGVLALNSSNTVCSRAPPDSLTTIRGPSSKGRRMQGGERKGEKGREGGRQAKGRKTEGGSEGILVDILGIICALSTLPVHCRSVKFM